MLNQVTIMGRLTADPELKHTPSGIALTRFSIANERDYKSKDGEKTTDFYDVKCWRGQAEFVCRYFSKGRMIIIDGHLDTHTYEDKDGKKRKTVEIAADNVYFGDSKKDDDATRGEAYEPPEKRSYSAKPDDFSVVDDDEDLPF